MGNPDVCSVWNSITIAVLCPCVSCRWRLTVACSTSALAWIRSSLRLWRGPTSTTPRLSLNRCVEHYSLVPRHDPGNKASGAPSSMLESCTLAGSYDFSRLVREQQLLVHAGSSFIVLISITIPMKNQNLGCLTLRIRNGSSLVLCQLSPHIQHLACCYMLHSW